MKIRIKSQIQFGAALPVFTDKEIKTEPMLHRATREFAMKMSTPTIICRKCGKNPHEIRGFLKRVNEKGVTGIWECRPSCDSNLTQDEALIAAIESQPEPPKP